MEEALEIAVLGLDPAKGTSGAAILIPDYGFDGDEPFKGGYALSDAMEVKTQDDRRGCIETLLETADTYELIPVVVAETWAPPITRKVRNAKGGWDIAMDQKWNYKTILGMGEGWGLWQAEIHAAELPILERVLVNDWRDLMFGQRRPKTSVELKTTAKRYFEAMFGYKASDNISEAALIGLCGATRMPTVAKAVQKELKALEKPKPARRRKAG